MALLLRLWLARGELGSSASKGMLATSWGYEVTERMLLILQQANLGFFTGQWQGFERERVAVYKTS